MSTAIPNFDPAERVAHHLDLPERGVRASIDLLEGGNTVPFIARYRKEATGGLDEVALASVEEAYKAVQALEKRREAIIEAIRKDGKLDPVLERQLRAAPDR
ncbi:MAG: RNA-binding transcriptional accessory protein, partial [Deltaproteobacteria bacterium]|nr:RNA-binding transcriptional accessory protein [Deltaproteobacteria bacterium]